jgi:hypothetical protein
MFNRTGSPDQDDPLSATSVGRDWSAALARTTTLPFNSTVTGSL